ncbi:BTB/POZ domain-containing protein [Aspergillus affinis]|uniref:BTB/POZ domain-containing protein n=1 Tax=Aspergillus affinis TaxID=1070780 RepID=UPI0022FEB26A|nr:uncharacterized protein KD926_000800 [Aspergillus affinis]KAI9037152.1 hypothetical protein KD926_000800 [Aspergillus affinis]
MESDSPSSTTQPLETGEPNGKRQPRPQELSDKALKNSNDFGHFTSSTLQLSLWQQYQRGQYTDLTVTCGDRSFQVHKVVVCAQSPFFDAACGGQFKESSESRIDLSDEDPEMVERLFQFLYLGNYADGEYFHELPSVPVLMTAEDVQTQVKDTSDGILYTSFDVSPPYFNDPEYDPDQETTTDEESADPLEYDSERTCESPVFDSNDDSYRNQHPIQLFTSLRMYVIADKYNIPALQLLARNRFTRTAEIHWRIYPEFPAVLDELYMTTAPADPLRQAVCMLIARYYFSHRSIRLTFRPIFAKHPDLSLALLDWMGAYWDAQLSGTGRRGDQVIIFW